MTLRHRQRRMWAHDLGGRLPRVLAATGLLVIVVSAGGCNPNKATEAGPETPAPTTAAGPTRTRGLPQVASAAPQPDPVAATLGRTATVSGSNLFGTESATIEVTLGKPKVLTEVRLKNGVVLKPKRGAFAVFDVAIAGVSGIYSFNPLHFHLIPSSQVSTWKGKTIVGIGDRPDAPTQIDELNSISFGSVSAGNRLSGTLVFDQPQTSVDNGAVVLRSLLLTDGHASAYWSIRQ